MTYYDKNSTAFFKNTVDLDMSELYEPFLSRLPECASILDAGCGSGRDSLYFTRLGHHVTAVDASPTMCEMAGIHTELEVKCERLQDLAFEDCFDGIWACASLLHVPAAEMVSVLTLLKISMKQNGILYASYKLGSEQRIDGHGRVFTDATEELARMWLTAAGLQPVEFWTTADVRPDRLEAQWLNLIAQR